MSCLCQGYSYLPQAAAPDQGWIRQGYSGKPILWRQRRLWSQLWLQGSSHHYWTSRTVQGILGLLLLTIQGQTVSWAEGSPSSSHLLPYFPLHGIFPDVSLMFNPIFPDYSILASTSQTPGMTKIVPGATHRNRQRGEDLDWQTHHPC